MHVITSEQENSADAEIVQHVMLKIYILITETTDW